MLIQTLKLHALTQIIYGTNCVIFYLSFLIFHHLLQSAIFGLNFFILNHLLFTLKNSRSSGKLYIEYLKTIT